METRATRVPRRNFDGLFVHGLSASGAFAQALRGIGYDAQDAREHYPLEVWRAALRVAREHACPGMAGTQADRFLGERYVEGFLKTPVGSVFAAETLENGPERAMSRLPAYVRAGRDDMVVSLDAVHEREWRLRMEDPEPMPDFFIGVLETVLRRAHVEPRVELVDRTSAAYTLRIRW